MEALRALTAILGMATAPDDVGPPPAAPVAQEKSPAAEPAYDAANPWSLTLTVGATNAYFFRCIPEEDRGAIVQPAFELDYEAHQGNGWLQEAWLGVGMFNSFHSGPTGTGGDTADSPKAWYEADYYFTMQGRLEHGFELSMTWWEYTSPNSQFDSITEVDATVAWDDGDLWEHAFKIHPSLTLARELRGQSEFSDPPPGTNSGTYLGLGIAPQFTLVDFGEPGEKGDEDKSLPLTLAFPVLLNLSLDHYYENANGTDETFGGLDLGAQLDVPLPLLGTAFGQWSFQTGVHYLILGDHMKAQNGGEGSQWIVSGVISVTF
jgi:hypothetical protein